MKYLWLIISIYLPIIACNSRQNVTQVETFEKRPLIVSDTSDSWGGDITLSITKIQQEESGRHILTVLSSSNGSDVGFLLELSPQKNTSNGFYKTGISIKSLGKPSDNFLQSLARVYQLKIDSSSKFIDSLTTTYVSLDQLAKTLGDVDTSSDVNTKLFFEDAANPDNSGELFLDFNEKKGWVMLKEKDIEYRRAVLRAFSKE